MKKQLIINADDFGIHEAVNRAVYRSLESGSLTSTSIMAGGEAFLDAVRLSRDMKNIGIGVHLTLVGSLHAVLPAEEVPSLTWRGGILCNNYLELISRDIKGLINADDVYREWEAQICKVLDAGISITHLDGHQHLHMWNSFFPIALALAKKYKIPCMRVSDEKFFFGVNRKNLFRSAVGTGLSLLSRKHRSQLNKCDVLTNDHFYGMLYGGHLTENRLLNLLDVIQNGVTEIMCHPSANEMEMERRFHWGYQGESEMRALLSAEVKEKIEAAGIELISYRERALEGMVGNEK